MQHRQHLALTPNAYILAEVRARPLTLHQMYQTLKANSPESGKINELMKKICHS